VTIRAVAGLDLWVQELDDVIQDARNSLISRQRDDGHWIFEFEADATISSDYVMLRHFLGEVDDAFSREIEGKIGRYLRARQGEDGSWPLYHAGDMDLSATVKAYFALKLIGDDPDAPHMKKARAAILARGGAANVTVFTRISLALFGLVPWRAVPNMPVEIMLLPRPSPFHLEKISYWSRTVVVPLLILYALKPRAQNPRGVRLDELFIDHPDEERYPLNVSGTTVGSFFVGVDRVLGAIEPHFPKGARQTAITRAIDFIVARLNGVDGLGGIFTAMANTVMAFEALGYPRNHPHASIARQAVDRLLIVRDEEAYCQACLSPVWDTCLAMHALLEAGEDPAGPAFAKATDWILEREITDVVGDWSWKRPGLKPGGWAFQYWNDYYPDVDDTAVVVLALDRGGEERTRPAIHRATDWVVGMQSSNGGWGAFDAENQYNYLNNIPFADHGALLDPPTVDVSARCLSMLAQLGYGRDHRAVRRAISFLEREQEPDGSWYGRWGVNYVYGTWSALSAINAIGIDHSSSMVRRAVNWLKSRQRSDGGWGEDCATYWQHRRDEVRASTPSQTAWALLGLMAVGEVHSEAVRRGVAYLLAQPRDGCKWREEHYTGIGFPRVFYLRYDGYSAYFPLWALARYRNLIASNRDQVSHGM
jgi:squalene-hopene/tetraprenyl-beta-curcumene cyclase